jgi:uncharacterized membrane protein YidH (DUF202 family)
MTSRSGSRSGIIMEKELVPFMMLLLLAIVFLLLFLSGVFQLLQAAWDLREGTDRNSFLTRGMLGVSMIVIAILVPYIFMFFTSVHYVQRVMP